MVIKCKILCFNHKQVEKGLKEIDIWSPAAFDFIAVAMVKEYCDDEAQPDPTKSVIYINNDSYITDIPLSEAFGYLEKSRLCQPMNLMKN